MSGWEFCVEQLKRARVVPPSCNVDNVVGMIRNGSALCRLLNILQPLSIDSKMISINPKNSKFLSLKNVVVFLDKCEEVFGFRREDLFEVNDLLNGEDLGKVLKTLLQLFSVSQAHNGQGFRRGSLAPPLEETNCRSLRKDPIPLPNHEESYDIHQEEEEKIYYRAIDLEPKNETSERKSTKQLYIDELISTEKNYVNILKGLLEKYKVKLNKILSLPDLNFIFSLIEKMLVVHKSFYEDLLETLNTDSRMTVAECFISKKEKFLVYGEYCSNVARIQSCIDSLLEQSIYRDAIEECQASWPDIDIKFRDLFIVPMQRILKYPLFLKESCLDHIPKDEYVERKIFSKALEEVEDLAQYVNEMKRDHENIDNIDRIESSIKDIDLKLIKGAHLRDYGRLLKDGEVKCKTLNKLCILFLFDRLLLLCFKLKDDNMLELNKHFMVSNFHLVSKQKSDKCFALLTDKQITEFKAKTKEERDDWLKKIETAKDNISPAVPWNKDTPPPKLEMHTYKEITICDICKKLLRGLFFQGYHCASPRVNVHKDCIPNIQNTLIPGALPANLTSEPWFAGNINRDTAESILSVMPDGSYLVRKKGAGYVVGIKFGAIHHIMVTAQHGQFGLGNMRFFPRIQDLVQFYSENSLDQVYSKLQTRLLYPHKCLSNTSYNNNNNNAQ